MLFTKILEALPANKHSIVGIEIMKSARDSSKKLSESLSLGCMHHLSSEIQQE